MEFLSNYEYGWSDVVGNVGVILLLMGYYLNVAGKLSAQGWEYNTINLVVAILLTINLIYKPNISALILEVCWASIAIFGLVKYWKTKYNKA